ncbi:MAG: hypothetical protein OXF79_12530 [Chloroflexi bacterium]|nr:hypothetical protein [Chloroflexota bacterium]
MTMSDQVAAVVDFMEERGFVQWPTPLMIRGVTFYFDAVLHGPEGFSDIILVCDTIAHDRDDDIVRQVLGFARALDMARKTNPLTTVIVGRRPDFPLTARLTNVSRVLALGAFDASVDQTTHLNNWLAVLTPLDFTLSAEPIADPIAALREATSDLRSDLQSLIDVAPDGQMLVQAALNALIERDLAPVLEDKA